MKSILWLFTATAVLAQPGIAPPGLGGVHDSTGSVYAVIGVAGSFQLSDLGLSKAISTAFSGSNGLVKTNTELLVLDASNKITARYPTPDGPALFAFDAAGAPALVSWSGALFRFENGSLTPVSWSGQPLAIAFAAPQSASLIFRRDDGLWNLRISLTTGLVESEVLLAGVNGPVALLANGDIVYASPTEIMVRDANRVERRVAAGIAIDSFDQMGKNWIAVRESSTGHIFAFRTNTRAPQLYQLPEVTQ